MMAVRTQPAVPRGVERGALNHDVVADAHGKASIDIDLDGRLHVVVDPAS
jgi:hypothetical protein